MIPSEWHNRRLGQIDVQLPPSTSVTTNFQSHLDIININNITMCTNRGIRQGSSERFRVKRVRLWDENDDFSSLEIPTVQRVALLSLFSSFLRLARCSLKDRSQENEFLEISSQFAENILLCCWLKSDPTLKCQLLISPGEGLNWTVGLTFVYVDFTEVNVSSSTSFTPLDKLCCLFLPYFIPSGIPYYLIYFQKALNIQSIFSMTRRITLSLRVFLRLMSRTSCLMRVTNVGVLPTLCISNLH